MYISGKTPMVLYIPPSHLPPFPPIHTLFSSSDQRGDFLSRTQWTCVSSGTSCVFHGQSKNPSHVGQFLVPDFLLM
jgi:hypothetical protein